MGEFVAGKKVPAHSLRTRDGLERLAREHVSNFGELLGDWDRLAPGRAITVGSACTGSAGDLIAFEAAEVAFREKVPQFGVKYLFNCENNARKREWIMRLHGAPEG